MFIWLHPAFGQVTARALCNKAEEFYFGEKLDSSLYYYQKVIEIFPNDSAYAKSIQRVAYISWDLKKYDIAKSMFLRILKNKNEEQGNGYRYSEYSITKNQACIELADIFMETSDFSAALKYLKLSEKKYPFRHFCGNAYSGHRVNMAIRYSECYDALNDTKHAINVLWDHIFGNSLTRNDASKQMKIVLLKKYSKNIVEEELRNADKTIQVSTKNGYEVATIVLFNKQIILRDTFIGEDGNTPEMEIKKVAYYQQFYRNSNFYKAFIDSQPTN